MLIEIFELIGSFFRRLEEYADVPMTDTMKEIMVNIMAEVLGIFAIVTKEIKQGRASESNPDHAFPIADRDVEKYLNKLIGRTDIEDALKKLENLTQEELKMAAAQTLKVVHHIRDGMEVVSKEIKGVGDKVNRIIEGTFGTLAPHKCILNLHTTSRQGNEVSYG